MNHGPTNAAYTRLSSMPASIHTSLCDFMWWPGASNLSATVHRWLFKHGTPHLGSVFFWCAGPIQYTHTYASAYANLRHCKMCLRAGICGFLAYADAYASRLPAAFDTWSFVSAESFIARRPPLRNGPRAEPTQSLRGWRQFCLSIQA